MARVLIVRANLASLGGGWYVKPAHDLGLTNDRTSLMGIPATMAASKYLTTPLPTTGMPPGVPYIVGNEAAERFSFYGMRAILVVFMTKHLVDSSGQLATMSDAEATSWYHLFLSSVYFFPTMGALLSDALLGKYRTIFWLSLVYCAGHAALAMDETRLGLGLGLTLIAIGSGGIKPCVSANVGDQFGSLNKHLLEKVYSWFYFSINFGAFFSTLLTPYLLDKYGASWAFGVPGIFMALATLVFWTGRHKFVHVPPGGIGFLREAFSRDGLAVLGKLLVIFAFVAFFWALYDQTGSAWILQAENMDRTFFGTEISAAQTHAANPIMILTFIPIFTYVIYPTINKVFPLSPLRKIGIGLFLTAAAFAISAVIESWIAAGMRPNIGWQFLAYAVITSAEVMVSITGLEFSYTQAPPRLKSVVMAMWLLSVSAGNVITALINVAIQDEAGKSRLTGTAYYWMFCALMVVVSLFYIVVAMFYREHSYTQDDAEGESVAESSADGA